MARNSDNREKDLTTRIEEISKILKGPNIPNVERLILHEERKELRLSLRDVVSHDGHVGVPT